MLYGISDMKFSCMLYVSRIRFDNKCSNYVNSSSFIFMPCLWIKIGII